MLKNSVFTPKVEQQVEAVCEAETSERLHTSVMGGREELLLEMEGGLNGLLVRVPP